MARTLYSWIGSQDLRCVKNDTPSGCPLLQIALETKPHCLELLWCDSKKASISLQESDVVRAWLLKNMKAAGVRAQVGITPYSGQSDRVMDFEWVYQQVESILDAAKPDDELFANVTSGTSIMTAAWIVRSRAIPNPLLHLMVNSPEQGVTALKLPSRLWINVDTLIGITTESSLIRKYVQGSLWDGAPLFESILGNDESMLAVKERALCAAQFHDIPTLILGAPGTGKSLLAAEIHRLSGRKGKLVQIDCGHLSSDTDIHSIFGWIKGSFTGADKDNPGLVEEAKGGTLLLDEVGNLPLEQQSRLLRFIQTRKYRRLGDQKEKHVDTCLIAATNANLEELVQQRTFRQDLYDRLRCVTIQMPALRDRKGDIMALAECKLREFQHQHSVSMAASGIPKRTLGRGVEAVLRHHDWPGNIRELEQLVARLVIFSDRAKSVIDSGDVQQELETYGEPKLENVLHRSFGPDFSLYEITKEVQRHYILRAAEFADGNKSKMAKLLGFGDSRTPLLTLMRRLGIDNKQ